MDDGDNDHSVMFAYFFPYTQDHTDKDRDQPKH